MTETHQSNAPERIKALVDKLRAEASRGPLSSREIFALTDPIMDVLARADRAAPEGQVRGANRSDGGFSAITPPPATQEPVGRVKVPAGQTPLDDKLGHRLLDVLNGGSKARDDGTGSPYHGHSLEHSLHAAGWIIRDLRLALDAAKATPPTACQQEAVTVAEAIKKGAAMIFKRGEHHYQVGNSGFSNFEYALEFAALRALKGEE